MTHSTRAFARAALWTLPVWAALLFLSTLTHQPDPQTDFTSFAAYVTTPQFLAAHLVGSILGAAIGSIGVIALMLTVLDTKAAGKAITGMVASVTGNTLTTSVFGAAAFAQTAAGRMHQAGAQNAQEFYNQVYSAPLFITVMIGLLLFIIGGIYTGWAIAISGRFPRWAGWIYAIATTGFVLSSLFLPVGQTLFSALLILATTAVAWSAAREAKQQIAGVGVSSEA